MRKFGKQEWVDRRTYLTRMGGVVGVVGVGVGASSGTAAAGTVINQEDVPMTITESGKYEVGEDLLGEETLVRIKADEVTLEGRGFLLDSTYRATPIEVVDASNVTVQNVSLNGETGVHLDDATECTVRNASIDHQDGAGIECTDTTDSTLEYNTTSGDDGAFGVLLRDSNRVVLIDNEISPVSHGIALRDSDDNVLAGNVSNSASEGRGIDLQDSDGNTLTNNEANRNNGSGIRIDGSNNGLVGNTADGNAESGIVVFGSDNTVNDNEVFGNDGHGIRLLGSNNRAMHNSPSGNVDPEMEVSGADNHVVGTTVTRRGSPGIHLTDESSSNLVVRNEVNPEEDDDGVDIQDDGEDNRLVANVTPSDECRDICNT
jgi:parallel beta-helix repeat protein